MQLAVLATSLATIQAGTLSGNPLAMTAGLKTLEILDRPGAYEHLEKITGRLIEGILQAGKDAGHAVTGGHISGQSVVGGHEAGQQLCMGYVDCLMQHAFASDWLMLALHIVYAGCCTIDHSSQSTCTQNKHLQILTIDIHPAFHI